MAFTKSQMTEADEAEFKRPAGDRTPINLEPGEKLTDIFVKEYISYERATSVNPNSVFHALILVSDGEEGILSGAEDTAFGRDIQRIGAGLNGCTVDIAKKSHPTGKFDRDGKEYEYHTLHYAVRDGNPGVFGPPTTTTTDLSQNGELED